MATIREVSEVAQVSSATVSRVVNGNKWVSTATRDRVLAAMAELGYQPNSFARALATNRSETIGMVVGDLAGSFFGGMMHSAEQEVRKAGKHLIITSGHDSIESERDAIDFLLQRRVDALILHLDVMSDEDLIALNARVQVPIVLVNRRVPELAGRSISLDNELGGYLATQHLLELGHRAIACITGPLYKADARARLAGYRRALEQANCDYDEHLVIESNFTESGGQAAAARLLSRQIPFTALFAQNDHLAIGAMNQLKTQQLRIPGDISLVGYDDMVMAPYVEPALTTVAIPVNEFGRQSALLALNLTGPPDVQITHRFKPTLVLRDSTARAVKTL